MVSADKFLEYILTNVNNSVTLKMRIEGVIKPIYLIDEFPEPSGASCVVVADVALDANGAYKSHRAYLAHYVAVNTILAYQRIELDVGRLNGEFMKDSSLLKGARLYVCTNEENPAKGFSGRGSYIRG